LNIKKNKEIEYLNDHFLPKKRTIAIIIIIGNAFWLP
jgi:hypothetical protein